MSGSVQKNDTRRENFVYREGASCTQKPPEIFEKSPPAEKAGVKQSLAFAVVGQLPEAAGSAAASSGLRIRIVINSSPVIVSCSYRYLAIS